MQFLVRGNRQPLVAGSLSEYNCPIADCSDSLPDILFTREAPNMWQELTRWDNLLWAYRRASKGKRGLPNVAAF